MLKVQEPELVAKLKSEGKAKQAEIALQLFNIVSEVLQDLPLGKRMAFERHVDVFVSAFLEKMEEKGMLDALAGTPPENRYELLKETCAEAMKSARKKLDVEVAIDRLRNDIDRVDRGIDTTYSLIKLIRLEIVNKVNQRIDHAEKEIKEKLEEIDKRAADRDWLNSRL